MIEQLCLPIEGLPDSEWILDAEEQLVEDLRMHLELEDAGSRFDRAARTARLARLDSTPDGRMLFGGQLTAQALWEAQHAYVNGLWLSCIATVQVCMEHLLYGMLARHRDDLAGIAFARLLREARDERFLSEDEFELFDKLRREIRNPYMHARPVASPGTVERRSIDDQVASEVLFEKDADRALTALLDLLDRRPFAWWLTEKDVEFNEQLRRLAAAEDA